MSLPRFCLLAIMFLGLTGCSRSFVIWRIGPGGAAPGLLYSDVQYPNELSRFEGAEIPYDPAKIEIVGWVGAARRSDTFTGRLPGAGSADLVGIRDSGYEESFREILQTNDLDGILNKTVDTNRWVLNLFIVRFYSMETVVGGVGFRFLDDDLRRLYGRDREEAVAMDSSFLRHQSKDRY